MALSTVLMITSTNFLLQEKEGKMVHYVRNSTQPDRNVVPNSCEQYCSHHQVLIANHTSLNKTQLNLLKN